MLVYVNDIVIIGSDANLVQRFTKQLNQALFLRDLGPLGYFLGIGVHCTPEGLVLSQAKYACELLIKANMAQAKPLPSPADPPASLSQDGEHIDDPNFYRCVIGAL